MTKIAGSRFESGSGSISQARIRIHPKMSWIRNTALREYDLGLWDASNSWTAYNSRESVTAWMDASNSKDSNIKRTKNLHILSQTDFS
jgi:hypothetical protein